MSARSPHTAHDFQRAKCAYMGANGPAESDVEAGLPEGLKGS